MFSSFSNSAYGLKRYIISSGGGGNPVIEGWIGDEIPINNDNILFFYDFEDNNVLDKSGNGNDGVVNFDPIISSTLFKNGLYGIVGDNGYGNLTNTRLSTTNTYTSSQGLTLSFWIKTPPVNVGGYHKIVFGFNAATYIQVEATNNRMMRVKPSNNTFTYGSNWDEWYHLIFVWQNTGALTVYSNGVSVYSYTGITLPPSPNTAQILSTNYLTNKSALPNTMALDDIRFFNTTSLSLENITALSNSLYDKSRLKLRLQLQDATDSLGNYNGVEYGNCIDTTRFKYGTKSLTSDGIIGSIKYVEMPAINFIHNMGMSMSFWFYNESGQSANQTRMIEAKRENNTISGFYIEQYKLDRTKFRFSDNTGCIFYASPLDSWHKFVCTITGSDVVNIWIDNIKVVSNITVSQGMSDSFDAGWRIGANNSNVANLCSFAGSIQEFKIWNRVLTDTEVVDVI